MTVARAWVLWVILGDPGCLRPLGVGELLPDCYSYQKPLRVSFTVQGGRFVTTQTDSLVEQSRSRSTFQALQTCLSTSDRESLSP